MKKAILALIKCYQLTRQFRPQLCRFYPSCSSYAFEAIEKHGLVQGSFLSISRLCRCHPFCLGGVDEVPVNLEQNRFRLSSRQV